MIDKIISAFALGFGVGAGIVYWLYGGSNEFLRDAGEMFYHHDDCVECIQSKGCCTVCNALWRKARKTLG